MVGEPQQKDGSFFTRINKNGYVSLKRLTAQMVNYVLKNCKNQAGLESFSSHDLHRTTIADLLSADVDVLTVSAIANHNSSDITCRYS